MIPVSASAHVLRAVTATDDNRAMAATRRSALLLLLMAIAAGGAALRFASLGAKPLWLDEAMTLLVSLGRGPGDIPIGRVVPVANAPSFLAYNADASLATVIERL